MPNLVIFFALSFLPYFEARNQAANFILSPPANGETVKLEKPDLKITESCPACGGEGKLALEEPNYGQANGRLGAAKKVRKECPLCNGRGKIHSYMNPSQLKLQIAKDRETFAAQHQGRGEIAVGEAFVSNERYEAAGKEKLKLVDAAYGRPCRTCNWTGIEPCKKCSGNGTIRCTNADCKGGWAVVKTTTEKTVTKSGSSSMNRSSGGFHSGGSRRTSRKESHVNVSPCPTCGGAQFLICPECGGLRAHPCSKCSGVGLQRKGGL